MHVATQTIGIAPATDAADACAQAEMAQALVRDQAQLLYQPIVDLQSGAVDSVEALVRWQAPAAGVPAAGPRAGEDGMAELGDWVLRRVCADLDAWRRGGHAVPRVAIKVAPGQLRAPGLADAIIAMLDAHAIAPGSLTLEISEAALSEAGAGDAAMLARFKELGLNLALDDFGVGHISLARLKNYPFDAIHIGAGFIHDVVNDSHDAAMVKSIIGMGHHLGMKVVAEGVDTESQCDFLRRHMCDQIQGGFFAPPLAAAELQLLLASGRALPAHLLRMHTPPRRLLLVDDEPNILAALKRLLRADRYQIYTACDGPHGLEVLGEHAVDVIMSDQRMPGMLGADFLRKAREAAPDTIRIMLSGYTELQSVTDAVNEGAIYKFLTKPWDDVQLRGHIAEAFRIKEIADDNQRLHLAVRSANQELAAANFRMEQLLQEKQRQISSNEISLSVARELLEHLPLAVIGMDDAGMIAFINGAAACLFRHSGPLLGSEAGSVLPELFRADGMLQRHRAAISGLHFDVMCYPMGEHSASRGSLITLSAVEQHPC